MRRVSCGREARRVRRGADCQAARGGTRRGGRLGEQQVARFGVSWQADAYGCDGARAGYVRRRIAQRSSQLATALLHPAARECLDLLFSLGAACIPG